MYMSFRFERRKELITESYVETVWSSLSFLFHFISSRMSNLWVEASAMQIPNVLLSKKHSNWKRNFKNAFNKRERTVNVMVKTDKSLRSTTEILFVILNWLIKKTQKWLLKQWRGQITTLLNGKCLLMALQMLSRGIKRTRTQVPESQRHLSKWITSEIWIWTQ